MFERDDSGVSDVLGSILLVAITVSMMVGLSIVVLNFDGPTDQVYADLDFQAFPGSGGWGTGDESVRLTHQGGEPVEASKMQIVISVDSVATDYDADDMDGGFSDGFLTIGETWSRTFTINQNDTVEATAVYDLRSVLVLGPIRSSPTAISCGGDVAAPTVQVWQQSPSDVTHLTVGSVTVTATLGDACSGPDDAVAPHLEFRINGGAWNDTGAMTLIGASQWTGSIPDPIWLNHADELLEYRLVGMQDENGNSGDSTVRSDLIAAVDPNQYVSSFVESAGSVVDFANAQSASDGGAEASLTESGGVITLLATTATGSGATNPSNAAGNPDNAYATLPGDNDQVTVSGFDTAGQSGGITKVEMVFEGQHQGIQVNDDLNLLADAGSGFTTVDGAHVPPLLVDGTHKVDITSLDASWTWSDVSNVELRAVFDKSGSEDVMDFLIDAMYLEVTTSSANDLDIEFQFPALIAGTNHTLEMNYSVSDDTFQVEVWDGSSWNVRGAALDQTTTTAWSYQLTVAEAAIDPLIRFTDASGAAPSGTLMIEFARVVTS